ncbi:MAG: PorT family protein [Cytophagaceae bacterium]|nr:PorT family protein [Cytophagaceae bacterium]
MQKRTLPLVLLFALLISLSAQAQVRFGVKAGLTSSRVISSSKGAASYNPRVAWQAGALADLGISRHFSIQPAVLLSSKGYNTKNDFSSIGSTLNLDATYSPLYIEVPILALLKINLGNTVRLFGGLGPYAAVGIGGQKNIKTSGVEATTDIKYGNDGGDFKQTDFGGSLAIGAEIGGLLLGANYNFGLADLAPGGGNTTLRNASLGLTIGYLFGSSKR